MNEYIIVGVIAVIVLFGGTQVPKIARSLGSAKSEFHKGQKEGDGNDAEGKPTDPKL